MTLITRAWTCCIVVGAQSLACAGSSPGDASRRQPAKYYEPPGAKPDPTASAQGSQPTPTAIAPPTAAHPDAPTCNNAPHQLFPKAAPWNTPVTSHEVASDSAQVIEYLQKHHSKQHRFKVDFALFSIEAPADAPRYAFEPNKSHYSPDCDLAPNPLPVGGHVEAESGYACTQGGDCHLLVVDRQRCRLYELYKADQRGDQFSSGCQAVWDLSKSYPETGRGEYCTSADAAGLPIAPFLFTPDEIARGEIHHALRITLPNRHIRRLMYVRPATHSTPATQGPAAAPPYGGRFRLRADADIGRMKPAAQVVAKALKKYGMVIADGGIITFTASSDEFTKHKWSEVGFGAGDLRSLEWTDFELVDTGPSKKWDGECVRQQITD